MEELRHRSRINCALCRTTNIAQMHVSIHTISQRNVNNWQQDEPDGFLALASSPLTGPVRLPSDVPADILELPPNANPPAVAAAGVLEAPAPNLKTFDFSDDDDAD